MTPEYKERRRLKHLSQNGPQVVLTENISIEPTPDGLGKWMGGPKKDPTARVLKTKPTQFASAKNTPGTKYDAKAA